MKKIVVFMAVITSAVVSFPVLSDPKPNNDENLASMHHSDVGIKPRANLYPLFFFDQIEGKTKEPSSTKSGSQLLLNGFGKITNKTTDIAETTKFIVEKNPIANIKRPYPIQLNFFAKAQDDEGGPRKPSKELTVSVPRYKTDSKGKWVYNPWAVTYADVWKFTYKNMYTGYNFATKNNYKTKFPFDQVCYRRSTVYNIPPVTAWIGKRLRHAWGNVSYDARLLHVDLRLEMFLQGKSEACHTTQYVEFRPYLECAILRNMRMEYLMPHYPLIQIGIDYAKWQDWGVPTG